jgi:predicted acetyltransferase
MIEIRRLCAEELQKARRLHTVVYNFRHDYNKEEKKEPDPLEHPPEWTWGLFEGNKLLSCMIEIEFLMRFDNHSVPMSGIGGVGTLPEARKGGHIRSIFEKLLPEAYEKGVVFSNLCPFSHAFYRKFGYEVACARNKITIATSQFIDLKLRGDFTHHLPGDDTFVLNEIHSGYIANLNHAICRDHWPYNRAWNIFTKDDPYATGNYIYLWRDENGRPRGYIKYHDETNKDGDHIIVVRELAFLDREALYGVLSIVGVLSPQFEEFQWLMPVFIDPADFVESIWDIEQKIIPRDMTRVVNVKAALEKMRHPEGEGAYIVEVEDLMISANHGKYLVEYGPEGSRVSSTTKEPDIRCDIPALSQLVTGYRTLGNALLTKQSGLEACGNRETLDKVFTLRPQHLTEIF